MTSLDRRNDRINFTLRIIMIRCCRKPCHLIITVNFEKNVAGCNIVRCGYTTAFLCIGNEA